MWTKAVRRLRLAPVSLAALSVLLTVALAQPAVTIDEFHRATHSHNDYYQPRPLIDALESGMGSIEADIFYVELPFVDTNGQERALRELFIAHDWEEVEGNVAGFARTKGTLTDLYLDPLWEIFLETGTIYPQGTLLLHADFKTDTDTTWRVLESTLRNYPGLFTTFDLESQTVIPGPVTVYTNDEPGPELLGEYGIIHSTADGRFGDIFDSAVWESPDYTERSWRMPIISSNMQAYMDIAQMFDFIATPEEIVAEYGDDYADLTTDNLVEELDSDGWALATRLIEDERIAVSDYLRDRLTEANRLGTENDHLMRFWASPDAEWFWELVRPLENTMILTDHPRDVSAYLRADPDGNANQ